MSAIWLKDGSMEMIFSEDNNRFYEFKNIIKEKLGNDAEDIVQEMIDEIEAKKEDINSDLESYEQDLENNRDCFLELLESIKEIQKILSETRINRKKLISIIKDMTDKINNQI